MLRLSKSGDANILVNASVLGRSPDKFIGVYSMGKAALINMAKWLSEELRVDKIRVNCIGPGFTETKMTEKAINSMKKSG